MEKGVSLFGYVSVHPIKGRSLIIQDCSSKTEIYLELIENKIYLNKQIIDKFGAMITDNIIGINCLIENKMITPNKLLLTSENGNEYILSFKDTEK